MIPRPDRGRFFRIGALLQGPAPRILWPPQAPDGLTLAVYRAKPHVGADYGPADR